MEVPVILSAVRTPVGKFQGGLASFSAPELGGKVVAEAARRAGLDPKQIDEAILGNVIQAGLGQNPARQAALKGGCDPRVAALTINKVCGSGLKAVALAAQKTLENLFGAFAITIDQPFREGDLVNVDGFLGSVEVIGMRSTRFRTADRTSIIGWKRATARSLSASRNAARAWPNDCPPTNAPRNSPSGRNA